MKKALPFLTSMLLMSTLSTGQYLTGWQNESFMHQTLNPALLGHTQDLSVAVQYNRRWDQLASSPSGVNALAAMPFTSNGMALGLWINRSQIGPLSYTGIGMQYAYAFPLGIQADDKLSMGLGVRMLSAQLDQSSFVALDGSDPLLSGNDMQSRVPPHATVGFAYRSGVLTYRDGAVVEVAGSFARYIPFSDRFNIAALDRLYQWYAKVGIASYLSHDILISSSLLGSSIGYDQTNLALRLRVQHDSFGWLAVQYGSEDQLLMQAGVEIELDSRMRGQLAVVGSYGWYFGPVGSQLGNGISMGVAYYRSLR